MKAMHHRSGSTGSDGSLSGVDAVQKVSIMVGADGISPEGKREDNHGRPWRVCRKAMGRVGGVGSN